MKKILRLIITLILLGITLWASDNNLDVNKSRLDNNETSYIPFVEVLESAKKTFPNYSEIELNAMFKDALWNNEKSAVVVYPLDMYKTSIYVFIKNEPDEFIGVDISNVERGNLGAIGLNLKFEKVETKAIKWMEHEKHYFIKV